MQERQRLVWWKRIGLFSLTLAIAAAMATSLGKYGGPMARAAAGLRPDYLAIALLLSILYRVVNAAGWGLVLRSLGEPVALVASARIWLASEACRWLPGSVWSYGSRVVLATRRGLHRPTVAASLVLELAVTVAAAATVGVLGGPGLVLPNAATRVVSSSPDLAGFVAVAATAALAVAAVRSRRLHGRLHGLRAVLRQMAMNVPSLPGLAGSYGFYILMASLNGLALAVIVRSTTGGEACPVASIVAGNAVAWLVGFFAIFAPGGLVVREACLASSLSIWLPAEKAMTIALAWRLVQVLAELACFAASAAFGLPAVLKSNAPPV